MSRFPLPPQHPLVDQSGLVTHAWNRAFQSLVPQTININFGNNPIGLPNTDAFIYVSRFNPGPTTLQAPAQPNLNQTLEIHDQKGDAATNPITFIPQLHAFVVVPGLAPQTQIVINQNYGWARLRWNGEAWSEIGHS